MIYIQKNTNIRIIVYMIHIHMILVYIYIPDDFLQFGFLFLSKA